MRGIARDNMEGKFAAVLKTPRQPVREALWTAATDVLKEKQPISVLDFGVYEGRSTRFWASHLDHPDSRFYGFDSFEGLPEHWTPKMTAGTFSTGGKTPDIDDPRVEFVKGWIQNTLPGFLGSHSFEGKQVLIHIDIDLYSAALFILSAVWHFIPEYYVIFDEFGVDENVALSDFSAAYPVEVEFYNHTYSDQYQFPQQVFGRIRNVEYTAK